MIFEILKSSSLFFQYCWASSGLSPFLGNNKTRSKTSTVGGDADWNREWNGVFSSNVQHKSLDTDDIHQSDFKKILKLFYFNFRDVLEVDKVQIILQRKVYS